MLPVVPAVRRAGAGVRRRTADGGTCDGQGHRTREATCALAEATTEPVNIAGSRDRVRDVVTVGVTDAAVRLDSSVSATVLVEVLPRRSRVKLGASQSVGAIWGRDARPGDAFGCESERTRPAGGAGGVASGCH
jgi:hypothetical protein